MINERPGSDPIDYQHQFLYSTMLNTDCCPRHPTHIWPFVPFQPHVSRTKWIMWTISSSTWGHTETLVVSGLFSFLNEIKSISSTVRPHGIDPRCICRCHIVTQITARHRSMMHHNTLTHPEGETPAAAASLTFLLWQQTMMLNLAELVERCRDDIMSLIDHKIPIVSTKPPAKWSDVECTLS